MDVGLLCHETSAIMQGNVLMLHQGSGYQGELGIRKNFMSLFLELFKRCLDVACRDMV